MYDFINESQNTLNVPRACLSTHPTLAVNCKKKKKQNKNSVALSGPRGPVGLHREADQVTPREIGPKGKPASELDNLSEQERQSSILTKYVVV